MLGILLAGGKQGMCPLPISVLENGPSEPIFVGNLDGKRERVRLLWRLSLRCLCSIMAGRRMEKFGHP